MTTIFTCEDDFEHMMTCIYDAWASRLGHSQVRLMVNPVGNLELFCEYRQVASDREKALKVIRSIQKKISFPVYQMIYRASMSFQPIKLDAIYRFLVLGFTYGKTVVDMLQEEAVSTVFELNRKVANEAHFFREFARFANMQGNVLVSHIEPKCNILTLLDEPFSDRMPSENWMIIDDSRNIAIVHPADQTTYLTTITSEEILRLRSREEISDPYVSLWKGFFETIGIKERKNFRCQRSMMPLWYRKNATEFR